MSRGAWPFDESALTPVSDGTVTSAFSSESDLEVVEHSHPVSPPLHPERSSVNIVAPSDQKKRRRPGRPKGGSNKLNALVALFDDPNIMTQSRRSRPGTTSSHNHATPYSDNIRDFHRACQYGQLSIIESMLRKELVAVDCRDPFQNTPLHEAVFYNQEEVVKLLLKKGADPHAENSSHETPTAQCRNAELSNLLTNFSQFLKASTTNPFLSKCWQGSLRDIKVFLQSSRYSQSTDEYGNTGLHYAAIWDHLEAAEALLGYGISPDVKNKKGNTPLHHACLFSSPKTAQLLLENQASYSLANAEGHPPLFYGSRTILKIIRKFSREHRLEDPELVAATETRRYQELTTEEEDGGALVNRRLQGDIKGLSREERKLQQMLAIFSKSSSRSELEKPKRKRGRPPKTSSIVSDDDEAFHQQLRNDPSSRRKSSQLDSGHVDKASGRTQLHNFALKGNIDEIRALLKLKKSLARRKDKAGYLALHAAALAGHEQIVEILVEAGSNVKAAASNGDTPLHDAANGGHLRIVKYLVEHGADPETRNHNGQTPRGVASEKDVQSYLRQVEERPKKPPSSPTIVESFDSSEVGDGGDEIIVPPPRKSKRRSDRTVIKDSVVVELPAPRNRSESVEIMSSEPLLQIHCGEEGDDDQTGWFFLSPQVEGLYQSSFPGKRLLDAVPLGQRRHLSSSDATRLIESAIMQRLSGLRGYLQSSASTLLLDKDTVTEAFERAGGCIANVPVMYVDLPRLAQKPSDERGDCSLPPKLKLKRQMKEAPEPDPEA